MAIVQHCFFLKLFALCTNPRKAPAAASPRRLRVTAFSFMRLQTPRKAVGNAQHEMRWGELCQRALSRCQV